MSPSEPNDAITYRRDFGCWWPNYDHKPEDCFKRVTSRVSDIDLAVALCSRTCVAIQAGGHAGLWPLRLAASFADVITFEPEPDLYACLQRNVAASRLGHKVLSRPWALGDRTGKVKLRPHCSAGSWRVDPKGTHEVQQIAIDEIGTNCDLLVLDVEGYEPYVLAGAARTIERCKPVIMVEELPRSQATIRAVLDELGYIHMRQVHDDHIYQHASR